MASCKGWGGWAWYFQTKNKIGWFHTRKPDFTKLWSGQWQFSRNVLCSSSNTDSAIICCLLGLASGEPKSDEGVGQDFFGQSAKNTTSTWEGCGVLANNKKRGGGKRLYLPRHTEIGLTIASLSVPWAHLGHLNRELALPIDLVSCCLARLPGAAHLCSRYTSENDQFRWETGMQR